MDPNTETFQPWRGKREPDELLEAQAGAAWKSLLDESRRAVDTLKAMTVEADRRLGLGARMLDALRKREGETAHEKIERQIAAFEVRLAAMESRLVDRDEAPRPHAMPTPKRRAA